MSRPAQWGVNALAVWGALVLVAALAVAMDPRGIQHCYDTGLGYQFSTRSASQSQKWDAQGRVAAMPCWNL